MRICKLIWPLALQLAMACSLIPSVANADSSAPGYSARLSSLAISGQDTGKSLEAIAQKRILVLYFWSGTNKKLPRIAGLRDEFRVLTEFGKNHSRDIKILAVAIPVVGDATNGKSRRFAKSYESRIHIVFDDKSKLYRKYIPGLDFWVQSAFAIDRSGQIIRNRTRNRRETDLRKWLETLIPASLPTPPKGLSASASSESRIDLTWTDSSTNETGFRVERSLSPSGPFLLIATLGVGTTTYADSGLKPSTTYYYRVRAYNGSGNSAYTRSASTTTGTTKTEPIVVAEEISTPIPPSAPTGVSASNAVAGTTGAWKFSRPTFFLGRMDGGGFVDDNAIRAIVKDCMAVIGPYKILEREDQAHYIITATLEFTKKPSVFAGDSASRVKFVVSIVLREKSSASAKLTPRTPEIDFMMNEDATASRSSEMARRRNAVTSALAGIVHILYEAHPIVATVISVDNPKHQVTINLGSLDGIQPRTGKTRPSEFCIISNGVVQSAVRFAEATEIVSEHSTVLDIKKSQSDYPDIPLSGVTVLLRPRHEDLDINYVKRGGVW